MTTLTVSELSKPAPRKSARWGKGATLLLSNHVYHVVEAEPYMRLSDGQASQLVTWQARCAVCDAPYLVKSGPDPKFLRKTCVLHKLKRPSKKKVKELRAVIRKAIALIDARLLAEAKDVLQKAIVPISGESK